MSCYTVWNWALLFFFFKGFYQNSYNSISHIKMILRRVMHWSLIWWCHDTTTLTVSNVSAAQERAGSVVTQRPGWTAQTSQSTWHRVTAALLLSPFLRWADSLLSCSALVWASVISANPRRSHFSTTVWAAPSLPFVTPGSFLISSAVRT